MKNFTTSRRLLFIILMVILIFPMLQQRFSFFESGKLNGAVTLASNPKFGWHRWWDGVYQKEKGDYLNDNTGCRPDLVRLNNEIDYRLFDLLHANGAVIGKDDYLYEQMYIDEYNGADFMGDSIIRAKIFMLKKIQDTLERLAKTFVYIQAPSKAWYFPDKFPAGMEQRRKKDTNNYTEFKRLADSSGIRQVDFNGWFMGMRDTSKNLLYSRLGTHWTVYGSLLAQDSLTRYLGKVRHTALPEAKWAKVTYTEQPRRSDDDLEKGANLISHFKKQTFCYPDFTYEDTKNTRLPCAIYIGDSYLWVWVYNQMMPHINSKWQMWYYFKEVYDSAAMAGAPPRQLDQTDWGKEIMAADCIIVLYTPANIKGFNYEGAFIDKMYRYFYK